VIDPSWPGIVPAIHDFFLLGRQDVDARHKAGHDEFLRRNLNS